MAQELNQPLTKPFAMKTFKICIVDDNEYFLRLFEGRIERHLYNLELSSNHKFELLSFLSLEEFFRKLPSNPDLIFLDYQLGDGRTAADAIRALDLKHRLPSIALVTEHHKLDMLKENDLKKVISFIRKDNYLIPKSCLLIEELVSGNNNNVNGNYGIA
ncbi:MAG: hypothetical protein Kow0075_05250 [Salibacteraceae bacterium]